MPKRVEPHNERVFSKWDGRFRLKKKHAVKVGLFVLLIGMRTKGKSTMDLFLLAQNADQFFGGIALTELDTCATDFRRIFPKSFVYDNHDNDAIERFFHYMKGLYKSPEYVRDNWLINIDDGSTEKKHVNTPTMIQLAKQGRHHNFSVILATQNIMTIGPGVRSNSSLILISGCNNGNERKKLWDNIVKGCGVFRNEDEFGMMLRELTKKWGFMVINQSADTVADTIRFIRADINKVKEPFRIGHRDFWLLDNTKRVRTVASDPFMYMGLRNPAAPVPEPEEVEDEGGGDGTGDGMQHTCGGVNDEDGDIQVVCVRCIREREEREQKVNAAKRFQRPAAVSKKPATPTKKPGILTAVRQQQQQRRPKQSHTRPPPVASSGARFMGQGDPVQRPSTQIRMTPRKQVRMPTGAGLFNLSFMTE